KTRHSLSQARLNKARGGVTPRKKTLVQLAQLIVPCEGPLPGLRLRPQRQIQRRRRPSIDEREDGVQTKEDRLMDGRRIRGRPAK
ncbi:hypothetical protein L9F63_017836, partial [Diploptera punctata]